MALTYEQNEHLVRTGPGTLVGELFRRYWIPALLAEEVAEPDGAPVRVQLLGERLVAFRDTQGRLGLIEEFCAHRGVSLWFGRNEECGLRCPYHGWKYDVTGQCVDLPSEAEETGMRSRIKLKSYPCIELAGVIWTYMGPPELKPEPPALEWVRVAPERRYVSKRLQESQLPAGDRRRHRLEPRLVSAQRRPEPRSRSSSAAGRTNTTCATACRTSRWWSTRAGC